MFISRREFYTRAYGRLKPIKKEKCLISIDELYEEAIKDAVYRCHNFLLTKSWSEIYDMEVQEQDGLKEFNYKTEGERFEHIKNELVDDTYETIRLYKDIDHPTIKHISNGFHRIFMAKKLGITHLRCEVWYGKWELKESISFEQFTAHLRHFKRFYYDMFREAKKDDPEKIKKYPQLDTFDGLIEFCELMTKKDKKKNTITILGTYYPKYPKEKNE